MSASADPAFSKAEKSALEKCKALQKICQCAGDISGVLSKSQQRLKAETLGQTLYAGRTADPAAQQGGRQGEPCNTKSLRAGRPWLTCCASTVFLLTTERQILPAKDYILRNTNFCCWLASIKQRASAIYLEVWAANYGSQQRNIPAKQLSLSALHLAADSLSDGQTANCSTYRAGCLYARGGCRHHAVARTKSHKRFNCSGKSWHSHVPFL